MRVRHRKDLKRSEVYEFIRPRRYRHVQQHKIVSPPKVPTRSVIHTWFGTEASETLGNINIFGIESAETLIS